jgi:hypothetical protein
MDMSDALINRRYRVMIGGVAREGVAFGEAWADGMIQISFDDCIRLLPVSAIEWIPPMCPCGQPGRLMQGGIGQVRCWNCAPRADWT